MADNTAKDIRSVIKNATQGGRLGARVGASGQGDTIATTEEITTQRNDNQMQSKLQGVRTNPINLNASKASKPTSPIETLANNVNSESSVIQATKNTRDNGFGGGSIFASRNPNPNQINDSGTKINDVEINGERLGGGVQTMPTRGFTGINSRIPEAQQQAKQDMQVQLGNAVRDLYTTAYAKLQNGETLTYDYVREKFPEFNGLSDEDLYQLASDATYLAQQGDYNLANAFELADAYGLDTALLFDELDPKTKGEYLTYLASGQTEKSPGLLDRVIGFGLDKVGLGGDATLQDFLNYQQENYTKAKIKGADLQQSELSDLRNLFNSYRDYYKADEKELNNFWKDIEKYYNGELGDGWMGNAKAFSDLLEGGDWINALNSKVKWKDDNKKEEFKKAYNEWKTQEKKGRLKNWGNNALYSLADLGVGAYSAANHLIDFAKGLGGLGLGTLENAAKKIGVMPEDTYEKLESTGPVGQWFSGIMQSSEQSADMIWDDYIVDHYGSADKFVSALMDDPFGVWSDFTGLMELGLKSGAKLKIGNLGEKIPVNIGGKTVWKTRGWLAGEQVAKMDPAMWMMGAGFKADETVLKAPLDAAKYAGKTIKWVGDVSGVNNFITKLANQATGLTEEQRAFIRENPDLVQAYITGEKSVDDLTAEMRAKYGDERAQRMIAGNLFDFLKNSDQQLDTRGMFYKLTDAFSELGATRLADGTIEFTKPIEESVKARIRKAYEYMDSISNGTARVDDVHWAREGIGGLTKWDQGHTMTPQESMLNDAMKDVYHTIGEVLKEQVKGWAAADKAYSEISKILTDFKEWFDKDGNLKDSAYGKISNLMNKNNKPKLERLLKYFPNFEKDIKALSAAKAVDRAMNATAGQYVNAALSAIGGGALFSLFTGGVGLGTVITGILAANYLTPKNFVKVLKAEGGVRRLAGGIGQKIIDKLSSGKKLNGKESDVLYDYLVQNEDMFIKRAIELKKRGELEKVDKGKLVKEFKDEKAKIEKQYKEGKISKEEYAKRINDIDYDLAQIESKYSTKKVENASKEAGDTEYVLNEGEAGKVDKRYTTTMEQKLGFRRDLEANLRDIVEKAKKEGGGPVRGYTLVKQKLYALAKNPTSTTAQHEFFHAVFSVVDDKTARYILDEAKRIMNEHGMSDMNAEERLAESFGTYAKRRDVKLGILDKPTTAMGKFRAAINDLFQKAYEWMQNYNGDRKAINKIFNEILKDEWTLDAEGKLDLSYLLNDKNPGGLKNKLGLESKGKKELLSKSSKSDYILNRKDFDEGGVAYKKDVNPKKPKDNGGAESGLPKVRYKKDINGKEVQIDTKATSPDQLIEKNAEGLSVMKSFISDKQAEKALSVNKNLLTKDGDAYLWTHTNKYNDRMFAGFENAQDSRYKEFKDNEIAWLTNSEEMSMSYADQNSELAPTKKFNSLKEANEYLEKHPSKHEYIGYDGENREKIFERSIEPMKTLNGEDSWGLWSKSKEIATYKKLDDLWKAYEKGDPIHAPLGEMPKNKSEALAKIQERLGDVKIKELKDGEIEVTYDYGKSYVEGYDTEKQALAEGYAFNTPSKQYHYQGIVQDMKKPLVVDIRNENGTMSNWNDLGTVKSFLQREDKKAFEKYKSIQEDIKEAAHAQDAYFNYGSYNKLNKLREDSYVKYRELKDKGISSGKEFDKVLKENTEILDVKHKIEDLFRGVEKPLSEAQKNLVLSDGSKLSDYYDDALKVYEKYKDIYAIEHDGPYAYRDNLADYVDKREPGLGSVLHYAHLDDGVFDGGTLKGLAYMDFEKVLGDTSMQTNDYVFYALRKGDYDGVLFKNISDYGGVSNTSKGGDVLAAFNSKQFKAWDNANPTDSKYISYKKDTGLKAKLPDTDNDGRKLSEAQRKFFAGTKVVDKNGNLLRVYHGTRGGDFTVFRKGNSWSNNLAKVGYWFTPNKEGALKFAEGSWGGDAKPRAEEVYLDIKNPKVYEPSKFNLLKNEERNAKIDEQRKVFNQKADKADGLDYTKAGGFFRDEFDHPYYERVIFEYLKRSWDNERKYDGKYGKYNPEEYRALADEWNRNRNANLDYDKILKDFEEYTKAKLDEEKEYSKLLDIKHNDPYDDFMYDIYKIDSNYDNKWTKDDLNMALNDYDSPNKFVDKLKSEGYDGIIIKGTEYDGEVIGGGARNDQYVAFDSNQIKRITNENPTKNDDIRFKKDTNSDGKKLSEGQMEYFKDSKVRDAQGRLTPVYHFTADDFNTVDFKKGNQNLFWFTSDGTASDRAQGVRPGMQRKRKDMYVDIKNPAGWEEYNKFGTDELKYRGYDGVILKNKDGSFEGFIFDKENQVKYTDNLNPTSSKDMRFKKDMGLKAKDQTQTPEFKKWFKGSKVVDKEGKPLEVYHGSRHAGFTEFKPVNSLEDGLYFFSDKRHIASYFGGGDELWSDKGLVAEFNKAKSKGVDAVKKFGVRYLNTPHEIEVTVNHITPKEARQFGVEPGYVYMLDDGQVAGAIRRDGKHVLKEKLSQEEIDKAIIDRIEKDVGYAEGGDRAKSRVYASYLDIKNPLEVDAKGEKFSRVVNPLDGKKYHVADIAYIAKEKGYDGVIIKNVSESPERNLMGTDYIVWKSNQIKSATDNIGTFDKNNPDIRYKRGYHGSSAKFNKFDSSHMGEGEGAQVHGWGHYIAIDKATAEKYAISRNSEYKGMPIEDFFKTKEGKVYSNIEKEAIRKVGEYIPTYTAEEAIEILPDDLYPPKTAYDRAVINAIQNLDPADFNSGRHLYDVDFKDPARKNTPSGWNYLDEETPYSRKTFDKIFEEAKKQGWDESKARNYIDDKLKFNGNDKMYGVWIRQALDMGFGEESGKKTSKFLESLGYDGIHYNGLQDGEAYVLFGDDTGKITNHVAFKKDVKGLGKKQDNDSGLRYKKAYHGSPADFDRFDSSHMGEGEGAQLHGWGHYVASDKDVAKKYYAEMGALKYKDKQIGGYDNLISEIEDLPVDKKNMIQHIAYEVQKKGKTASEAKNDLINSYTKDIENLKGFIDKNEKKLEQLKKAGKTSRVDYQGMINNAKRYIDRDNLLLTITKNLDENDFSKRNLYELEIPDPIKKDTPTGSNYWEEWDSNYTKEQIEKIGKELAKKIEGKPLEEATMKDVENIAKAMHNKLSPASQKLFVDSVKEWVDKGHDIKTAIEDNMAYYTSLSSTADGWLEAAGLRPQGKYYDAIQLWRQGSQGRNIYTKISSILGSDKKASKFLESLGYDGIHYYGGRDGEAYVLFNDDAIKINDHIRYKKAYHGGGKFDKFDLSHAGEGEGNQAHGYGLYFTENEARAREYGDLYRNNKYGLGIWGGNGQFVTYKGKTLNQIDGEYSSIIRRIIEGMQNRNDANPYYTAEAQIAAVRNGLIGQQMVWDGRGLTSKGSKERFNKEMAFLDSLNPKDFKVQNEKRNLYEVNVPNKVKRNTPTGSNYLEEEKVLSKEAKDILKNKLFERINGDKELLGRMSDYMGNMFDGRTKVNGKMFYQRLSDVLGSSKDASKFLQDLGYDGIHYIGKEDGSSYVLFNDNAPQIQNYIRYKKDAKGLAKKSNGLQRKAAYNVPQQSKTKIGNGISKMRNILKNAGISANNHTKDGPLKNAVKMITEMNKEKDKFKGTPNFNAMVQGREEGIMGILDAIDKGYNNENLHYKWFYDPKGNGGNTNSKNHPTVLIWEGDFNNALQTYKDFQNGLIKEDDLKLWAQHMDINSNTKGSIDKFRNPRGKLEVTPLRPRKRKRNK